jgi:hypothetical protein
MGRDKMSYFSNRRDFLKHSAVLAISLPGLPSMGGETALPQGQPAGGATPDDLREAFLDPPEAAWPWVYWMVTDGMLTKEGITADLEAMRRVGIRGLIYMECDLFIPKGPVRFMTPEWRELIEHAEREASRLGITIDMNNDGGYSGSGGPWITPELSMQVLTWSETRLDGGKLFSGVLPQPRTVKNYYRDITVLAFPTAESGSVPMRDHSPRFTHGLDRKPFDSASLLKASPAAPAVVPLVGAGLTQYLNVDFDEPFTAKSLTLEIDVWNAALPTTLSVSNDGEKFETLRKFSARWPVCSVNFPEVSSKHFRIEFNLPEPAGDWIFHYYAKGIPLRRVELHSAPRIEDIPGKASFVRQEVFESDPATAPDWAIPEARLIDLASKMDGEGRLTWDAPAGNWTILRIGHTSTGKENHPAPAESMGLECDKLSRQAIEFHFDHFIQKLLDDRKSAGDAALTMVHIDSWEVGAQNWTPGLREEFTRRRGYDPVRYLATLAGHPVGSAEIAERFLWDFRRTIADLLLENYAGHMRTLCNQRGLRLSIEAYGNGPYSDVEYGGRVDVPMCEFWTGEPKWQDELDSYCKEMSSAGHLYGKPIIQAESFTSGAVSGKWQNHPFMLKPLGDRAFTLGANRFVIHRYSMQPWLNRKPGMTFGPFGLHYERTNTWWEQSRAWHSYLARCQALLQRGRFVADIACLGSEGSPQIFPTRQSMQPSIPPGYDFDCVPPEVILERATVKGGCIVLESGMSYRVLVLPPGGAMTPRLAGKIRDLVAAGATVVGPAPTHSPSLVDYPRCDDAVRAIAREVWADCDGESITRNHFGKGKVVWGEPFVDVLQDLGVSPDFACTDTAVNEQIRYIHRTDAVDEIYFVASNYPEARRFLCTFRVSGKRPELWWPDTGEIEPIATYEQRGETTAVPLALDPYGSVFVVLRDESPRECDPVVSIRHDDVELTGLAPRPLSSIQFEQRAVDLTFSAESGYQLEVFDAGKYEFETAKKAKFALEIPPLSAPLEITGPWRVEFPEGWGAPPRVTFDRLISWTDHPNPGVKYFSGAAAYRMAFHMPSGYAARDLALYLDLGRVAVIAEVKMNGRDLGVLWKPPFRVEITQALRVGANDLEVRVVNLWPNRLIGDDKLPPDCDWIPNFQPGNPVDPSHGWVLKRYPEWLLEGKPSPTGHVTFAAWKLWFKDDPLFESGLLGPVRIIPAARRVLEP